MCCALSAQESLRKHCEKTACRDACKGCQSRKEKKDVTSSRSQAGVNSEINKTNTSEASLSVFFLCLLPLSVSGSVFVCCWLLVVGCWLLCLVCAVCVWCETLEKHRVYVQDAAVSNGTTPGDVLNVHTRCVGEGEVVVSLAFSSRIQAKHEHVHEHLNSMLESSFIVSSAYHEWPTCYHLHKKFRHLMFENRLRTTCSRFSQSYILPDKAVKLQSSGGNRWREPALRWFGFVFRLLLQVYRKICTPVSMLHQGLSCRYVSQTYTHRNIYTQHIHKDAHAHSHV